MGKHECQVQYISERESGAHHQIDVVFVATTSNRRIEAIKHACPNVQLYFMPGGEESKELCPEDIADQKAQKAKEMVAKDEYLTWETLSFFDPQRVGYLGADTVTCVPKRNSSESFHEQQGKIDSLSQLFTTFLEMERGGGMKKEYRTYYIHSGTSFHNGSAPEKRRLEVEVELSMNSVKRLASPEGREEYLQKFQQFYSLDMYKKIQSVITPWDLSAGLSLPVLESIGAIHSIDAVPHSDPRYPEIFRQALYTAAIGFHPDILNKIHPEASNRIKDWHWLRQVSDMSIHKRVCI